MDRMHGENIPRLGFGFMRLPTLADNQIDFPQLTQMVDAFLGGGFTYFDTAYGYMGERSEPAIRQVLVDRYPREKYRLATKLPLWLLEKKEDMERLFSTQLERTGAGYFDYYLLHNVNSRLLETLDAFDAWGFIRQKKADGLVRHIGFSFHDEAKVLDQVLAQHPEVEFVQLQINYMDWENSKVQSRLCYEVARKHGCAVIVMEPVKGGMLASLNGETRAVLESVYPGRTPASWAMRYAASLEGLVTVLSGMTTLEQVQDNINTFTNLEPMTGIDREAIDRVIAILTGIPTIPCTDCRYCMENCPKGIPIPGIIDGENTLKVYGIVNKGHYAFVTRDKGKASDCVACGVCEERCPQNIEIIQLLREAAALFE